MRSFILHLRAPGSGRSTADVLRQVSTSSGAGSQVVVPPVWPVQTEVIHRRGPWRSFEAVDCATPEWVDWFIHRRLLEPIGNIPLAEAEADY